MWYECQNFSFTMTFAMQFKGSNKYELCVSSQFYDVSKQLPLSNFLFKWSNRRTNYHPPLPHIRAKTCSKPASALHLHRNKSLEIRTSDTDSNLKVHLMNCAVKAVSRLLLVIIFAAVNPGRADSSLPVLLMVSFVTFMNGITTLMFIYDVCWKNPLLNLNTLNVFRFANVFVGFAYYVFCW